MTNRLRTEGDGPSAWPPAAPWGHGASWRRASGLSDAPARAGRCRPRPIRSIPTRRRRCGRCWTGILYLEQAVTTIEWGEGLVLRYGGFYGPGTAISLAPDAAMAAPIRKRQFPIVGDGGGVWSLHPHRGRRGGDRRRGRARRGRASTTSSTTSPRRVREWLPVLASALDAKPPRRIPRWLGRLAAGEAATVMMTEVRGASNAKAKRELGWQPRYPSWRQGFAAGTRLSDDRGGVRRAAPVGVRHRLPDARQRQRGGGRRAGGVPPPPPGRARAASGSSRRAPTCRRWSRGSRIDQLRSARVRRETYVGEWLPEPLVGERPTTIPPARPRSPTRCRSPSSSCSRACRPSSAPPSCCARCSTTPTTGSREIVGTSEQNARQLATRARRHVEERRPRFEASREQRDELASRFFAAAEEGDLEGLEELLADDVVLHGDGGGKAPGRSHARSTAAPGWRARCSRGLRAGDPLRRRRPGAARRSTASPARCSSTARAG